MRRLMVIISLVVLAVSCVACSDTTEMSRIGVESLIAEASNRIDKQCKEIAQDHEKRFIAMSNGFAVCAAKIVADMKEDGEKRIDTVVTEKGFYESRYEELKDAHEHFMGRLSVWLAVIGIAIAIFGVTMPIIIAFFQHKSYDREIEKLRNEMQQDRAKELRLIYRDCVSAQKMMLSKYVLWFDNKLSGGATYANVQYLTFSFTSIMFGFHQLVECAMRSRDERLVKDQIGAFKGFFDKVRQHPDRRVKNMWSSASAGLKTVVVKKDDEAIRGDYESVLRVGSESFGWLESFYKDFAAWKFA